MIRSALESVDCPACGPSGCRGLLVKDGHRYVACAGCGTGRLDPLPAAESILRIYDASYFSGTVPGGYGDYGADEVIHRRNARARLEAVRRALPGGIPRDPLVVDVGCAYGFFLDEAIRSGWGAVGVDVSPHARSVALGRFSLRVHGSLEEAVGRVNGAADAVTFFQSLEHMRDPSRALSLARTCLRRNGALVLETWDRGSLVARLTGRFWQQVSPPSVIWLFTRDGLRRILEREGFGDVRIERASKRVSVGWVASVAGGKHALLRPVMRVASMGWLARRSFSYSLGDLISVTAVRR